MVRLDSAEVPPTRPRLCRMWIILNMCAVVTDIFLNIWYFVLFSGMFCSFPCFPFLPLRLFSLFGGRRCGGDALELGSRRHRAGLHKKQIRYREDMGIFEDSASPTSVGNAALVRTAAGGSIENRRAHTHIRS